MWRKTLRGHDVAQCRKAPELLLATPKLLLAAPELLSGHSSVHGARGENGNRRKKPGQIPIPENRPPRPPKAVAPVTSIWAAPGLPRIPAAFEPLKEPLQIPASDIP